MHPPLRTLKTESPELIMSTSSTNGGAGEQSLPDSGTQGIQITERLSRDRSLSQSLSRHGGRRQTRGRIQSRRSFWLDIPSRGPRNTENTARPLIQYAQYNHVSRISILQMEPQYRPPARPG